MFTVGIDMGGTFTDGYVTDGVRAMVCKVPTTHFDLSQSVVGCLRRSAEDFGLELEKFLADVDLLRIATTIGTNAVVEGTGDAVGVIVEPGAEQSLYGAPATSPAVGVFVDADHVRGVPLDGDAEDLLRHCRELVAVGVRRVVVSFRGGNDRAEQDLRHIVTKRYPEHYLRSIPLSIGSELTSTSDDEVRTNTAILNAYVSRPMAKLLYRTEGLLQQEGLRVPVMAVRSDASAGRVARTTAIATYSSGPACGLSLVARLAREYGDHLALGFDMGGTTLDLGLVVDGAYPVEATPELRGVRVALPVPRIASIGLGGSSIAAADHGGSAVTVGPDSAGAVPGPACFGRGGTAPTVTDADLVLGFLDAGDRFGDEIELVAGPARDALESVIGGSAEQAAARVRAAASAKGAAAVSAVLADAGVAPSDVVLYAFGGAGALHASGVAEAAGIFRVRSFLFGSIFSACGVASGDVRQVVDAVLTSGDDAAEVVDRLVRRAALDLEAELLDPATAALSLVVTTTGGDRVFSGSGERIVEAVAAAERNGWRRLALTSIATVPTAPPIDVEPFDGVATRTVRWSEGPIETPLLGVAALRDAATVTGPALLHVAGVVHAVAPGWTVRLDGQANLEWSRT